VAVPRGQVGALVQAVSDIAQKHDVMVATLGHAGDGNLHPTFVLDREEGDAAVTRLDAARTELYEAALRLGGTVTGEHGIGVARRDWLVRQRGPEAVEVMRSIKRALDPRGLLNPGRML
jgi:glycolate oxidase